MRETDQAWREPCAVTPAGPSLWDQNGPQPLLKGPQPLPATAAAAIAATMTATDCRRRRILFTSFPAVLGAPLDDAPLSQQRSLMLSSGDAALTPRAKRAKILCL